MKKIDLRKYSNTWYKPGNKLKIIIWYLINLAIFKTSLPYPYKLKVIFLRVFGSKIGKRVLIKPNVNIKYPWFLQIGDNVWIGEDVWIDNLAFVKIGSNVCISQGVYIFTGSHNYKKEAFDLIINPIIIEDGVWVGAKAIICPGVTLKTHSVITVGSIINKDTESYTIYQLTSAKYIKKRIIE